jgi:phage FluMu gp28-like protein
VSEVAANDLLKRELPAAVAQQFDAETPAVFLGYQQTWVADTSQLKVGEKSRRIGLTWAEAADDVLISSSERSAGGQNCYYIGYNMDMAIEYIEACAMWARVFNHACSAIEDGEEVFKDGDDERHIKTYTIRFASGFRIVALSSRPANLRGKQGVVIIDEAAFHGALDELLKAALALLIWGGKVRIISTHDGDQNPFNELVNEIRSGKRSGSVHRITFQEAIADGLYRRVCMRLGKTWNAAEELTWTQGVYAFYGDAAEEELNVVPSQGSGAWLTTALIEARMRDVPVLRYTAPKGFEQLPDAERWNTIQEWLEEEVAPHLTPLDAELQSVFGKDFGRTGDLSVFVPAQISQELRRDVPFIVELRNMPHKQQIQIARFIIDRLPRFVKGSIDARGNGHALAEFLAQAYGYNRIELVMLTEGWYRTEMPPMKAAFEDGLISIPRDKDILVDLRAIKVIKGVARVPDQRTTGSDGGKRHGDAGVAIALMYHASRYPSTEIAFMAVPVGTRGYGDHGGSGDHDDYHGPRAW